MKIDMLYDVIVIGAGHAGCEAAIAAAKMGCSVMLLTLNLNNIAHMPCNPSVGGPGKGHLVREIDALGGMMGQVADLTHLQMRELNTQKGPAVRALRAQTDKRRYQETMQRLIEEHSRIYLRQGEVIAIEPKGNDWQVILASGIKATGKTLVMATGTFLRGLIHLGTYSYPSGPQGQHPAVRLAESMESLGVHFKRFKTGTPARIRWRSLNFDKMTEQPGDDLNTGFSFWVPWEKKVQVSCWLTYTNDKTHAIIRENLHRAALFCGAIKGVGPRYCPSIESKLIRFPDRERHQVFIEPEGKNTDEGYVAGLSTSLPEDVQEEFLRTIPGLESVEIVRPGYAIEYDVIPAETLSLSLEMHKLPGIFCAGQLNGSSGYEEAAAQGIMAGINAACKARAREPFILRRDEAYIGVLIDDLVNKPGEEPYRIMTSRAEFRLSLRHENADLRLTDHGYALGMISKSDYQKFLMKKERIHAELERLKQTQVDASEIDQTVKGRWSLEELLKRPDIRGEEIYRHYPPDNMIAPEERELVINQIKYQGYIKREKEMAERLQRAEARKIPGTIRYEDVPNLSAEAVEKLSAMRPVSLGQAGRINGISPADLCALLFYLQRGGEHNDPTVKS